MCINITKHCDGFANCVDKSDETDCKCAVGEFQCHDGACILGKYRCDYDRDCRDASDELGCGPTNCSAHFFGAQPNGELLVPCNRTTSCVLQSWFCDGHNDCWDGEDEENCEGKGTLYYTLLNKAAWAGTFSQKGSSSS